MGLTWPGYETLVSGQLGLHLFLSAGTQHEANTQTKETQLCPLEYRETIKNGKGEGTNVGEP